MSEYERLGPKRLAAKLRQLRVALGLTQEQMRRELGYGGEDTRLWRHISRFERGERLPNVIWLLRYSRVAAHHLGVASSAEYLEALVDDELDLPRVPSSLKRRQP